MKVLHVAPSIAQSYGGPTQSLVGYAASARSMGIDVSIAAPQGANEDAELVSRKSGVDKLHLFPSISRGAFIVSPALIRWLRNEAHRFDLIHVHGLFNPVSSLANRTARHARRPVVLCPHGSLSRYTFIYRRTLPKLVYFSLIDRENVARAAAIHFTTETEWAEARRHRIDFEEKAHVVPPPFLAELPTSVSRRQPNGSPKVALFLSRIHPVKNLAGLLEAWRLVIVREPSARLVIAGSGDAALITSLQTLAARLGIAHSVTFYGFVGPQEKARLLSQATLFVLPSFHENFGVVVLEAIGAGVPTVISPEVQLAPFVQRHDLGVVTSSEPTLLAEAILKVMHDSMLQSRVAAVGPELVSQYYSEAVIGRALAQMYVSAIANKQ